tara:strand:+ start:63476 stop:65497 length:2022 start_codon:yes stop_codon:yes gene_type:complete
MPLVGGVGMRLTFYDINGNHVSATGAGENELIENYSPQLNHSLIASSAIPTGSTGIVFLSREVDASLSPSTATQGSLDFVAYGFIDVIPQDGSGSFYWSDPSVSLSNPYFYCTESHEDNSSDSSTAPTGVNSKWTQDFLFKPSYGTSVNFSSKSQINQLGEGYYEYNAQSTNSLKSTWNLIFDNRSDTETRSILHFLENNRGAKDFFWEPPYPYNKRSRFKCENFSVAHQKENSSTISATFVNDNADILNWKNAFSPYTGAWQASKYYKENDYITYLKDNEVLNHDKYYYCKKDAPQGETPSDSIYWNNNHFYWLCSEGQNVQFNPRVKKISLKNSFEQISPEKLNENQLSFNLSFNSRSTKEAAAISSFLQHHLGHSSFTTSLPLHLSDNQARLIEASASNGDSFNLGRIEISGSQQMTLTLGSSLELPGGIERLHENQELIFNDFSSEYNKFYLAEDVLNNASSIKVKCKNHAGPITDGSTFTMRASASRFYCSNWTHSYKFHDNESISLALRECPLELNNIQGGTGLRVNTNASFHGLPDTADPFHTGIFIENTGVADYLISSMQVSNDGHGAFAPSHNLISNINPDFPFKVEAGSFHSIYYSYDPQATLRQTPLANKSECDFLIRGTMNNEVANIRGTIVGSAIIDNNSNILSTEDGNNILVNGTVINL